MRWMALVCAGLFSMSGAMAQEKDKPKPDPSEEFFKPTGKVPVIKVTVDADNLKLLKKEPRKYIRCTVEIGKEKFEDVGVHVKGAAGSSRDWEDKPALTLNLDKFKHGQNFKGLDKIHLNNSVQDGSYFHEILASEMYRAVGVVTARACHAIVELNGGKVGLYVVKEGYNSGFLKRNFPGANTGTLYDGGFLSDIDAELKLDTGEANDRKELKALAKACQEGNAEKRYASLEKLVNIDHFVKFTAIQSLSCDWDGYPRNRNNYRLYFNPKDGKAYFIPHGMDQLWQNPGEALWPGWQGMVARAILDTPEGKKKLIAATKEIFEKQFVLETLNKRIDEWGKRAKEGLTAVNKDWGNGFENEMKGLKDRLKQRVEFAKKEIPKLK